jgi:putative two-component system response regulator
MLFEDLNQPLSLDDLIANYTAEELGAGINSWGDRDASKVYELCAKSLDVMLFSGAAKEARRVNYCSLILLAKKKSLTPAEAQALVNGGYYYHSIADVRTAQILFRRAIGVLNEKEHLNALRRAYAGLGIVLAVANDNVRAVDSVENALRFAYRLNDPAAVAAVMSNAAVVFGKMGLFREALKLSLKVLENPGTGYPWAAIKVQAAGNAIGWASRLGHFDVAQRLVDEYREKVDRDYDMLHGAVYFHFCELQFLLDLGNSDGAEKVGRLLRQPKYRETEDKRALTLARIGVNIADAYFGTKAQRNQAISDLVFMYKNPKDSLTYITEVLLALVRIHSAEKDQQANEAGIVYANLLLQHLSSQNLASFYYGLKAGGAATTSAADEMIRASLESARSLVSGTVASAANDRGSESLTIEGNEEIREVHSSLAKMRVSSLKNEMRTEAYEIAEQRAVSAELMEDSSGEHCFRVGFLAGALAQSIGLDPDTAARIEMAARLHDIGKAAVNEMIRLKPGKLNMAEHLSMREHTIVGHQLLSFSTDPTLVAAADIAKFHHESWDGSGYPSGLRATAIPLSARITALAESYDAMTHDRPYRPALSHEQAVAEIRLLSGKRFDPEMVEPFIDILTMYEKRYRTLGLLGLMPQQRNPLIESRDRFMSLQKE